MVVSHLLSCVFNWLRPVPDLFRPVLHNTYCFITYSQEKMIFCICLSIPKKIDYYRRLSILMWYLRAGVHSLIMNLLNFSSPEQTTIVSLFIELIFTIIKIWFGLLKVAESSNQDENNNRVSVLSAHISELSSLWTWD